MIEIWEQLPGVDSISAENGTLTLLVDDSNRVLPRLFETAAANAIRITSVEIELPNLESVFLHLTGRALRD
jgi:ABC-2 type transport system ATP-binding protein